MLAVGEARMATCIIFRPTTSFNGRTLICQVWVLSGGDFNFCVRSTQLREHVVVVVAVVVPLMLVVVVVVVGAATVVIVEI